MENLYAVWIGSSFLTAAWGARQAGFLPLGLLAVPLAAALGTWWPQLWVALTPLVLLGTLHLAQRERRPWVVRKALPVPAALAAPSGLLLAVALFGGGYLPGVLFAAVLGMSVGLLATSMALAPVAPFTGPLHPLGGAAVVVMAFVFGAMLSETYGVLLAVLALLAFLTQAQVRRG